MNPSHATAQVIGRYALYGTIAAGGMATVHFGRLIGPAGFSRTVAIKRLHPEFAADPEFVSMFLDEARLAARIRHPNVVPTLDVVATAGELFLVMEYVPGESLGRLVRAARARQGILPPAITVAVMVGVLQGLHAAHEAKNERGDPLGIVHRDVSPQNVLLGSDGQARVLDFGVAKAVGRLQTTREGQVKGKLAYMAPEQLQGMPLDRQTDIYAASVVLWEALSGERLFRADNEAMLVDKVLDGAQVTPSGAARGKVDAATAKALERLDDITMRGLSPDRALRFGTAREMALALERAMTPATTSEVSSWIEEAAREVLVARAGQVGEIECSSSALMRVSLPSTPPPADAAVSDQNPVPGLLAQRTSGAIRIADDSARDGTATISVSSLSSVASAARRKRRLSASIASIGFLSLVLLSFGALMLHRAHAASAGPPETVGAHPAPVAQTPGGTSSTATSSNVSMPATSPVDSAPTAPRAAPSASTQAPDGHTYKAPARQLASPPAVNCKPPFTYDAAGMKHYKPECI